MVGGQEQDELGNMMTLKYFWFPILITGAGISLIKQVCRRWKIKDSLQYVWKHVTDWSLCEYDNVVFASLSKISSSMYVNTTCLYSATRCVHLLGSFKTRPPVTERERASMRIAASALRCPTELQKDLNWTHTDLSPWALSAGFADLKLVKK